MPLSMEEGDEGDKGAGSRYYEQKFPETEDLVMVKVTRIADMGAYASLLEYAGMEGMILMSELSKIRFRSVNKLIKVGRHEVVMVLRVDKEKGYIDLSKRRVSHADIAKCEDRYSKSKKVHQTVRHVAEKHDISMDELNQKVVWPLYRKYGHALDALKEAAVNADKVFEGIEISDSVKRFLVEDIRTRLSPTALKLQARIHVACFGYDGIDAVKDALLSGKAVQSDGGECMKIKLIAAPQYVVVTACFDKEDGVKRIEEALKAVEAKITSYKGGEYKLHGEITVLGGEDESRQKELFDEEEAEEESSEEESEEEDEGMGLVDPDAPPDYIVDNEEDDTATKDPPKEEEGK